MTPPLVIAITAGYGWRASFWASAAIGLFGGLIWYVAARDSPSKPLSWPDVPLPAIGYTDSPPARWTSVLRNRNVLALTVSYFTFGYIAWVFFAWFFIYLAQVRGLDLKTSALYSTLPFLCMTIGCLGGGVVSDILTERFGRWWGRCVLASAVMALTSALLVLGSQADSARVAGVVLACGAGTLYIAQSCFWAVATDIGGAYASVAVGLMNMGAQLGGAVTASLTPVLAAHMGWHMPFYVAAALALVGALSWLTVRGQTPVPSPLRF